VCVCVCVCVCVLERVSKNILSKSIVDMSEACEFCLSGQSSRATIDGQ